MTQTQIMPRVQNVTLDSGQRMKVISDPYSAAYECPRCKTFTDDVVPNSHFDGEHWVRMYYCWDCIEAAL